MFSRSTIITGIAIGSSIGAIALGYVVWRQHEQILLLLEERNFFLLETASTTKALGDTAITASSTIAGLTHQLTEAQIEIESLKADLKREENRNEEFAEQIADITGTVGDLTTLASIDEELLQKYSKVYFLSEHYTPKSLVKIPDEYVMQNRAEQYFHKDAWPFLKEMLEEAAEDGIELRIVSAYRSFDQQAELKGVYTQSYGSGANAFSADQGYSEHQLGTAIDILGTTDGLSNSFAATPEYEWLVNNAYKYGFILSYPEGNQYYIFEPWHWRFVGTDLARDLKRDEANFYDWEQRKIDEYLLELFD